jgi:hypothetical protein
MESKELEDGDYALTSGCGWFTVKGFAIRIHSTDEGVAVDIYENSKEMDGPISSAYGLDCEVGVEERSDAVS